MPPLIVGFTGSRTEPTQPQLSMMYDTFFQLREDNAELHHGDCVGKDHAAHLLGKLIGYQLIGHPPDIETYRAFCKFEHTYPERPYLVRNQEILKVCSILVAVPDKPDPGPGRPSGTWWTIRRARRIGMRIYLFDPRLQRLVLEA